MNWQEVKNMLLAAKNDYAQLFEKDRPISNDVNLLLKKLSRNVPSNADFRNPQAMSQWAQAAALNAPMGMSIKTYHASPYKFDKFDISKIGDGEGAQAYGKGLYFAENQNVAKDYYNEFASNGNANATLYETSLEWPDKLKEKTDPLSKKHFLDYKKRIDKQSDYVKSVINNVRDRKNKEGKAAFRASDDFSYPEDVLKRYGEDALKELGLPGIRYLDQGSRARGTGSYNYVVFDDNIPNIINRTNYLLEKNQ